MKRLRILRTRVTYPFTAYDHPQPVPPGAGASPPEGPDATREFAEKLSSPNRWVIKPGVPIFKAHERTDPATGQLIKVDLPKLYRIAANMQRLERQGGVPIRMTLGHTEPGKPETQQPPVGGYYKNARVQAFGPKGEPAIVVDEWLDPQYQQVRKNFPYRSSEYYDDAEQITGVALLTRDPYLDLGVVAYERGDSLVCYTASSRPDRRTNYSRAGGRQPVLYHLVLGETPMFDQNGQPVNNWLPAAPQQAAVPQGPTQYPSHPQAAQPIQYQNQPQPTVAQPVNYGQEFTQNDATNYSAPWPGPAYQRPTMQREHPNTGAIYSNQGSQRPRNYGASNVLGGAAGGATLGGLAGGPVGAVAGGLLGGGAGAMFNSRYSGGQQRRGRGARYEGEDEMQAPTGPVDGPPAGPGAGGPPGDPIEQVQMLLMAAVEALGSIGGEGPGGPPQGQAPQSPFPPEAEEGRGDQPYSRYAGGAGRPQGRGRSMGRYSNSEETPVNYGQPRRRPVPYGAVPAPQQTQPPAAPARPPMRTISGRPVGEALQASQLQYQLQQTNQALRVLMYERDESDTQACISEIQRLADAGYAVGDYEVGELKAKSREQRPAYIQHIMTKYQRIGTETLPPLLGDPTPAGPDTRLQGPATKDEMDEALKILASGNDQSPTAYSNALRQVRYSRLGMSAPGTPAPQANQPFYGYAQGPSDYPQGFNNAPPPGFGG